MRSAEDTVEEAFGLRRWDPDSERRTPKAERLPHRLGALAQGVDGPVNAQLSGERRTAYLAGDFGHALVLVVAQTENATVALRQRVDQRVEDAALFVAIEGRERV